MADEYAPATPEDEDFDINFNGTKMREILEESGLADTDIANVMNNVRMAQQMKMVRHEEEGRNLAKSTRDFHFVVTVNHSQISEILHEADVSERAIVRSLTGFSEHAKQVAAVQARPGQKSRTKHSIYWAVNCGKYEYYPPSDPDHYRLLLHSNDKDPIPTDIVATGSYPHVVVITKHWQTALHILNKLKHSDVRIIYVEFIILGVALPREDFSASILVQEQHSVHEWANLGDHAVERAIEKHIEVDRTYPKTRGVKGVNMYPIAAYNQYHNNRAPAGRDNRRTDAEPPTKRRPLLDTPPRQMLVNNWEEKRHYGYDSRDKGYYDREKSKRNDGGSMAGYGYVNEPAEEQRYSYDDYTTMTKSKPSRSADYGGAFACPPLRHSTPLKDDSAFLANPQPYEYQKASAPIAQNNNSFNASASFASMFPSQMGLFAGYGGSEQLGRQRTMADYKIPKKTRAPGAMDAL